MYGPELTCVSMEHMIISPAPKENSTHRSLTYAAMFEKDEKPVHVSYHVGNVEGEGLIMVMPSPEEGMAADSDGDIARGRRLPCFVRIKLFWICIQQWFSVGDDQYSFSQFVSVCQK
ncbi:hypothetical protein L1049_019352 [Liquidambar formosana]|uniref:Uncharacterized protein n=1 Tax=Liquidambar formosana TaxID=63359 RepID=A0AAP0S5Q3_LIQFO